MKFDFTPDPKVLLALTHTPMQPLDALCELIDNSIDSFHSAKIQGLKVEHPAIYVTLPTKKQLSNNTGVLRIRDNGPGMTAENAEKAIKAGFSGNNPYDTLGLFGMGFNISTGKLGNITTFYTAREDSKNYIKTVINLEKINMLKDYSLDAYEIKKDIDEPFSENGHGTIIEVSDWWHEGNANRGFIQKLVGYGLPKIREEIGRRYATILRKNELRIIVGDEKCEAFEHCVWDASRFVTRKTGQVPAVINLDKVVRTTKRCGVCTAILGSDDTVCPECGSTIIRTIEERVHGWIGIQRFDDPTFFGIDLIRNGRAIRIGEKSAFFEYEDEFKDVTKDYPIDSQYGRIVGEINLDFVPVDFLKQDFQRSSVEWHSAMEYIRGNSSLQPSKPNAENNHSPLIKLYQAYRRVRNFGQGDMYMGYWDADAGQAKRISRDIEKEYYEKFKQRIPGYYDDSEWWKLVETADQKPVEDLITCPECGFQNLKEAEQCMGCGHIFKGKECLNAECKKIIPISAKSCPFCGSNQVPVIVEPWVCQVCGTKNIASNDTCIKCGRPRGAKHPLLKETLLEISDKIDELSNDAVSIKLADESYNKPLKVNVYSTKEPMVAPTTNISVPLIIDKQISDLTIFLDLSHPFFTKNNLSAEQLISSEIAMYLYDERKNLSNYAEHNLSNLTWNVLSSYYDDRISLSVESVSKETEEFLKDIQIRTVELLHDDAALYFDELTSDQKQNMTSKMLQDGVDISTLGELKNSGRYILYTPYEFILNIYNDSPDIFFGGGVWDTTLVTGDEDLLTPEIVNKIKDKIISQYRSNLSEIIEFSKNKYSDPITLQKVKLSISFLRKGIVI